MIIKISIHVRLLFEKFLAAAAISLLTQEILQIFYLVIQAIDFTVLAALALLKFRYRHFQGTLRVRALQRTNFFDR